MGVTLFPLMLFADDQIVPPIAPQIPYVDTLFGEIRTDPYHWLRDRENPEVIRYLEAENQYTEAMTQHTAGLQETLFQEMKSRIKETDESVPVHLDDYFYYWREEEGQQYAIYCRKKGGLDAPEEILLNENQLAKGHDFFDLGTARVSTDHNLLVFAVDTTGYEQYTLYIKDLRAGMLLPDRIPHTSGNVRWATDNQTLFYTTLDETQRPYRLYRHRLGTDPAQDTLLYQEDDGAFFAAITRSKSKKYLFLTLNSKTTSEVHYLPAGNPSGTFTVIHAREPELEYDVEHHGDYFYILTNADDARNYKLMRTPVDQPERDHWETVIPHRDSVRIDDIEVFQDYLVIVERENGITQLRIRHLERGEEHFIAFPEPSYTCYLRDNPTFETTKLRFVYSSFLTPPSVFDYDMATQERTLLKQREVLGGFNPDNYRAERIWATAQDGTRIPISLMYAATDPGQHDRTPHPLYLTGYGAYSDNYDPYFSSNRLSLVDRGFVYAIAHIRGGGEMGRDWYDAGRLLNKKNSFTDFIACAEHLITTGYTSSDQLVISGGSAGGLLMGAVTNMRPDLFQIVVAEVPFVDVLNTMLDPTIPLTITEYDEWGNPQERIYYDYIRSYSPYDNVTAQAYPHMIVTAGLNDSRVGYWEPAKWVAKLRSLKTDDHLLILKTNMGAGHGGASGRYDYLREIAFEYAVILDLLGMAE